MRKLIPLLMTLFPCICFAQKSSEPDGYSPIMRNALSHYFKREYDAAFPLFEEAAGNGEAKAYFYLGQAYEKGRGTSRDMKQSFDNYMEGARLGDEDSQYTVYIKLLNGEGVKRNPKEAYKWKRAWDDAGKRTANTYKK